MDAESSVDTGERLAGAFPARAERLVAVTPLLTGKVFERLRDPDMFMRLTIDPVSRTIVWPNGADLASEALYDLPSQNEVA